MQRYIRDVEPIKDIGMDFSKIEDVDKIIEQIIEEPLKLPIKLLNKKGIKTIMSSANKNNLLKEGQKPKKKEDVRGKELYLDCPTFLDAGIGYAWIMIDYNSLSDDNKNILFSIEEKKDNEGNAIGEDVIWFVKSSSTLMFLLNSMQNKKKDIKFEEKAFILSYNNRYPDNVVFIRRPIDEKTTVKEVERFFCNFADKLKDQAREIEEEQR